MLIQKVASMVFWEEQLRAARVKDPHQVYWHLLIIHWCLNPKHLLIMLHKQQGLLRFCLSGPSEITGTLSVNQGFKLK